MDVLRSQITYCSLLLSVFKSLLKTFNEIVLVFLPVESKANILYVNINFNGNLFFGFGIYCGKVVPEPGTTIFLALFEHLHSQRMFFQHS